MPAHARRLAVALAVSALGHAAVLAGAPAGPRFAELSVFPEQGRPVRARLAPPAEDLWQGVPPVTIEPVFPGVPPVDIAQAPDAREKATGKGKPAGLPMAVEVYYRGAEVDVRAEATNTPNVEYPGDALSAGVAGVVRLQLKIDHQGVLREATVVAADPAGVFDQAALKAARALRFKPAVRNGVAVGSIKVIEVPFEPNCMRTGSCISESGPAR